MEARLEAIDTQLNKNLSRQNEYIASAGPVPDSLVTVACTLDEKPFPIPVSSRTPTAITNSFDGELAPRGNTLPARTPVLPLNSSSLSPPPLLPLPRLSQPPSSPPPSTSYLIG